MSVGAAKIAATCAKFIEDTDDIAIIKDCIDKARVMLKKLKEVVNEVNTIFEFLMCCRNWNCIYGDFIFNLRVLQLTATVQMDLQFALVGLKKCSDWKYHAHKWTNYWNPCYHNSIDWKFVSTKPFLSSNALHKFEFKRTRQHFHSAALVVRNDFSLVCPLQILSLG